MHKGPFRPKRFDLDGLFGALADPDKIRVLTALRPGAAPAGRVATRLGWRRDEASKQLNQLKRAGLVAGTPQARSVHYALVSAPFNAGLTWLSDLWMIAPLKLEDVGLPDSEEWTRLASALRNPGRRRLLECLCEEASPTQAQIARACGLTQGQVSEGLSALTSAGLATSRRVGPVKRYRPEPLGLTLGVRWLLATYDWVQGADPAARRRAGLGRAEVGPRRRPKPAGDPWG